MKEQINNSYLAENILHYKDNRLMLFNELIAVWENADLVWCWRKWYM
jgi:hypothetical protein